MSDGLFGLTWWEISAIVFLTIGLLYIAAAFIPGIRRWLSPPKISLSAGPVRYTPDDPKRVRPLTIIAFGTVFVTMGGLFLFTDEEWRHEYGWIPGLIMFGAILVVMFFNWADNMGSTRTERKTPPPEL